MRKKILICLFMIFSIAGFSSSSLARQPEGADGPPKEQRDRIRKRIETLRMWKLTETLDLDEETSAKLFPVFKKYRKKRAGLEREIRGGMRDLRESLRDGHDDRLMEIINGLERDHKKMQSVKQKEFEELKKILTLKQQAKFIIFQQEFKREIGRIISDARGRRPRRFDKNSPPERDFQKDHIRPEGP